MSLCSEELASRCRWRVVEELGSDHKPIMIEMSGGREELLQRVCTSWAWKRAEWTRFEEELEEFADGFS